MNPVAAPDEEPEGDPVDAPAPDEASAAPMGPIPEDVSTDELRKLLKKALAGGK